MAGLDLVQFQEVIAAYVRQEFPGYEVYEDDVIDNVSIHKVNGKVKPYIVLNWGGLNRNTRGANFGGVRYDEYNSSVSINLVAPTGAQARKGLNVVMDKLIGWKPTNGGALTPYASGGTYPIVDEAGRPQVYVSIGRLSFAVNSEDPGAPMQP